METYKNGGGGEMKLRKEYIGDSVYAEFDGYDLILTTENGYPDDPRNRIVLEPIVLRQLEFYIKATKETRNELDNDTAG